MGVRIQLNFPIIYGMKPISFSQIIFQIFLLLFVISYPSHAAVDFETEIRDLEKKITLLEGSEKAKYLSRLVDIYDNRSPKIAIQYCELLRDEYIRLNDSQGVAATLYNWGNYYYYTGYYDNALEIYQEMITHCKKNDLPVYLGRAHVLTGRVYYKRGDYDTAMTYYEKSLEIRKSIDDQWGIYCSLNNMGHVFAELGNYTQAVKLQYDSLKGYDDIGDKFGIGFSFENIGKAYFTLKDYDKALRFFLKSYDAYKEIQDHGFMGFALLNIGNCYRMVGESKLAFTYYSKGMETAKKNNLGWVISWAMAYESAVFNDIGKYDESLALNEKAEQRFLEIDDQLGLYYVYKTFIQVYLDIGNLEKAGFYMEKRLTMATKNDDRVTMADSFNFLGTLHTRLKSYDDAKKMLEKGRALAEQVRSNDLLSENIRATSILFTAQGNHKQGLAYFKQHRDIENQKASNTTKAKLLELQRDYETQRLTLEKKVTHLSLALATIAGCLIFYAIFRGFRHYHLELAQRSEKNRALQVESKLKLFQARINPHFLFNSLDSVIQLGQENNPEKLKLILLKLSNIYRNLLAMPDLPVVDLLQELTLVRDYLEIEKEISQGRIDFSIDLPGNLEQCSVIPLCILTLVENAVKHGLAGKIEGGTIAIGIEKKEHSLLIRVIDNGIGFDPGQMDEGFGLYSIQKRLELYYGEKAFFNIESQKGDSTTATIGIPYEKS